MIDSLSKLRVAALLSAAALAVTACDPGGDAESAPTVQRASAAVNAKGGNDALGTDQSVEDSDLTTKVREAILADPRLQSQHIKVETEDAAVTLTGIVDSPSLRERAVELAGSVDGVAQVQDRLRVRS
jgi:hyperosmotically inducible protein